MNQQISATGIAWYNREDYPRILQIMTDRHLLPPTYEAWRKIAERTEREAKRSGVRVVRAVIKPEQFLAWCAGEGHNVDAKARIDFASAAARRSLDH